MAEAQDPPNEGEATPPAPQPPESAAVKKTPADKTPAKKAPAKKAPAKKAPAKKAAKKAPAKAADAARKVPPRRAPAKKTQPALEPAVEPPALEPPAPHAALVAGNGSPPLAEAAREAAANAKSTVEHATNPVSRPPAPAVPEAGRSPLPFAVGIALVVLIALIVRRLWRDDE